MRILLITGVFEPELGGPATYTARLAEKLVILGHTVKVITYSDKSRFDFDGGYSFELVRVVRHGKASNYLRFFWVIFNNIRNFDAVYSLDWVTAGLPLYIAAILTGKKYGIRVGGGYIWEKYLAGGHPPITLKDFYSNRLHRRYPALYCVIRLVLRGAKVVVFNSKDQAKIYKTYYGLKEASVVVIPNPTPDNLDLEIVRDEEHLVNEIIFAGRFVKVKNIETLVRAFAQFEDFSYKLVLIGEGPDEQILRTLVRSLNISNRVIFESTMPQKELFKRIVQCRYIVLPSWTDISPNQIYECLAFNIPFLLTKENYLPIADEDFLKIDPSSVDDVAEKMNSLLSENEYGAFVGRLRKIKFVYSWDDATLDHLDFFKKML